MKRTKLSAAVHILSLVALSDGLETSSTLIAKSADTNASYVRRIMSELHKAGLLTSEQGAATHSLGRPAKDISLLEVFHAVEPEKHALAFESIPNEACGVGANIQYALQDAYDVVEETALEKLANISLAEIVDGYRARVAAINPAILETPLPDLAGVPLSELELRNGTKG